MSTLSRGTTEDTDNSLGDEACSSDQRKSSRDFNESDESRSKKRLRWVSAVEKTQGTSITSSHTSNSRARPQLWYCVDQILYQREMDPELLLSNLGFGGALQTDDDDTLSRIPDRFLLSSTKAHGVDGYQSPGSGLEFPPPLPVMGTSQLLHGGHSPGFKGTSPVFPETSPGFAEDNLDGISFRPGSQGKTKEKGKGSMQRPTFSAVAQGMKFIDRTQTVLQQPEQPLEEDEETKQLCAIPSILDFQNRRALARQGFYGHLYAGRVDQQPETKFKRSLSAAEKRKQFHSGKTKVNWSFTDDSEEGSSSGHADMSASVDSWDQGLVLKSFSDRCSSESSIESIDSYGEESNERMLKRENSISNLRKQYEETIMKSMDGEVPVFEGEIEDMTGKPVSGNKRKISLGEIRQKQVERLMNSLDDDGDYFAHPLNSGMKERLRPALASAQKSTQSTLTGSPVTPKEFSFSFEQSLNDGEGEFNFRSERAGKQTLPNKQSVSIIVEEEPDMVKSIESGGVTPREGDSNELAPSSLPARSDSCNTLVPQDSNYESEHLEGDLTPHTAGSSPGIMSSSPNSFDANLISIDALSESTGSSTTMSTVIHDQLLDDLSEPGERSRSSSVVQSRPQDDSKGLKAPPCPAQESFELEEISSAEDYNGNTAKTLFRKGTLEKSPSNHSDSSGFADLDTVGEATLSALETGKNISTVLHSKPPRVSRPPLVSKASAGSSSLSYTHHIAGQQLENPEHQLAENIKTVKKIDHQDAALRNDLNKENTDPELQSISFSATEKAVGKSLVYTVDVPLSEAEKSEKSKRSKSPRYVSSIALNLGEKSSNGSHVYKRKGVPEITTIGPLTFQRMRSASDLDLEEDTESNACKSDSAVPYTSRALENQIFSDKFKTGSNETVTTDESLTIISNSNVRTRSSLMQSRVASLRDKERILEKKRVKEALISAKSHTADWLLNKQNERQNDTQTDSPAQDANNSFKIGRPSWASTPNLKPDSKDAEHSRRRIKQDGTHSFEFLFDKKGQNPETCEEMDSYYGRQREYSHSVDHCDGSHLDSGIAHCLEGIDKRQHLREFHGGSNFSSMDESVDMSRPSLIGSFTGVPEEQVNYIRLARLVNGPSLLSDISKMPNSRFTPNFHMKNWTHLSRRKHLEEETLLMQHAVQRYKTELCLMENMLFALYRTAQEELTAEDRHEVEELQQLWVEVRKEVIKMEELLAQRLKAVMQGNESYSPLEALEIIQSMIDLLREQLYHQQMCIGRDLTFVEDDLDLELSRCTSVTSPMSSVSGSWMNDISSQVSEIKSSLESAEQQQRQELQERMKELKSSLLAEVRSDVSETQNARMLQLQLQARENEVRRLKMELLLQNIGNGGTRRKQTLESDV